MEFQKIELPKQLDRNLNPVLHPLRQVLEPADHVGGQALIDLLGVGQAQAGHQGNELLLRLCQPWVVLLLLTHGSARQS